MSDFDMGKIIGKKVVAIKGYKKRGKIEPSFILFDDGKTYIELEEQDYYTHHDCSSMARQINVYQIKVSWESLMNSDCYRDASVDI